VTKELLESWYESYVRFVKVSPYECQRAWIDDTPTSVFERSGAVGVWLKYGIPTVKL